MRDLGALSLITGCRVLLLQGPAGPLFRRVAVQLRQRGAAAIKVNFNAADGLFFNGPDVVRYRGCSEEWPAFFEQLLRKKAIDAVILFGDTRPMHRAAKHCLNSPGTRRMRVKSNELPCTRFTAGWERASSIFPGGRCLCATAVCRRNT